MANGPLAAVFWEYGVLFAGIIAILYADVVVIPSLRINSTYYGWRFSAYLGLVFTASAVGAGTIMHALLERSVSYPMRRLGGLRSWHSSRSTMFSSRPSRPSPSLARFCGSVGAGNG